MKLTKQICVNGKLFDKKIITSKTKIYEELTHLFFDAVYFKRFKIAQFHGHKTDNGYDCLIETFMQKVDDDGNMVNYAYIIEGLWL